METSPVGVVVLEAATGNPLSVNRQAKRVLGGLLGPDLPLADAAAESAVLTETSEFRTIAPLHLRNAKT